MKGGKFLDPLTDYQLLIITLLYGLKIHELNSTTINVYEVNS